jgi:hypothetical protein
MAINTPSMMGPHEMEYRMYTMEREYRDRIRMLEREAQLVVRQPPPMWVDTPKPPSEAEIKAAAAKLIADPMTSNRGALVLL